MKYVTYLGVCIFACFAFIPMIRCLVLQHKLFIHLRKNHFEKWKYLTTIFGYGPGMQNGLKSLQFLFGNEDYLGDLRVTHLRVATRNAAIYTVTGMLAAGIFFFIMVFIVGING